MLGDADEPPARLLDAPVGEAALDRVPAEAVEVRREDASRLAVLYPPDQRAERALVDPHRAGDVGLAGDLRDLDAVPLRPLAARRLVQVELLRDLRGGAVASYEILT